jgi:hypothetical protein
VRVSTMTRVAGLAAIGLTLTGCSSIQNIFSDGPDRAPDGQVTQTATADAFSLKVGDCLNSADLYGMISEVPFIPCDEPHDSEVYASMEFEDSAEFPGNDAIDAEITPFCEAEFEKFIGIPYADSQYAFWPLTPSDGSWTGMHDREGLCIVASDTSDLTSSLKGAAS